MKPIFYGSGGHYRLARRFVPAASQAAGILWSFRNPSTKIAVIHRVRLRVIQIGNPTAAVEDRFSLFAVRNFSVMDTAGVSIAPGAAMQKLRSTMGSSVAEIRESSVAAGLTAGTGTEDAQALATGSAWVVAAIQTSAIEPQVDVLALPQLPLEDAHTLVLDQNSGFRIRNDNALGTASGVALLVDLAWAEVENLTY